MNTSASKNVVSGNGGDKKATPLAATIALSLEISPQEQEHPCEGEEGRKKAVTDRTAPEVEIAASLSPPRVVTGPLLTSSPGVLSSRPSAARRRRGRVPSPAAGALVVRATLSVRSAAAALSLNQENSRG
jgi:hypothetical protein